jgi:hypothetical protein
VVSLALRAAPGEEMGAPLELRSCPPQPPRLRADHPNTYVTRGGACSQDEQAQGPLSSKASFPCRVEQLSTRALLPRVSPVGCGALLGAAVSFSPKSPSENQASLGEPHPPGEKGSAQEGATPHRWGPAAERYSSLRSLSFAQRGSVPVSWLWSAGSASLRDSPQTGQRPAQSGRQRMRAGVAKNAAS